MSPQITKRSLTMRWLGLTTFIVGAVLIAWPRAEQHILRCPNRSIQEHFTRADIVMTGSVAIVLPGDPYAQVMVTPETVYKGDPPRATKILAIPTDANMNGARGQGDLNFASDQPPYLLFLRSTDDGYLTSKCDGSRLLGSGLTMEERSVLE